MNFNSDFLENYRTNSNKAIPALLKQDANQNIVISTYSILSLLSILLTTSDNDTQKKLRSLLCNKLDQKTYLSENLALMHMLQKDVTSANGLFMKKDLKSVFNLEFTKEFQVNFNGNVEFCDDLIQAVNTWGEKKTKGDIRQLLDPSMTDTILCLTNAICFEAKWASKYKTEQIKEGLFKNLDQSVSKVTMLHSKENIYLEDDNWIGFAKPYACDFSFMALLPKNNETENEAILDPSTKLDTLDIDNLLSTSVTRNIAVSMPEFTIEYGIPNMIEFFMNSGHFSDLFSDDLLAKIFTEPIPITQIIHKACIKVDAKGTKASAVSAAISRCMIMEEESITLDRPFVFTIIHNETKLPIFSGILNNILKNKPKT